MSESIYPFFSFSFEYKQEEQGNLHILVIFKPLGKFDVTVFADYLAKELLSLPVVDQIVILMPCINRNLIDLIKKDEVINNSLARRGNAAVQSVIYDDSGKLEYLEWLQGRGVDIPLDVLFKAGLRAVSQKNPCVIQKAPPNCIFSKSSGDKHQFFIRGSQLLGSDTQTSFLSFLLLPYFDREKHEFIYIDSMSISPLVYKIITMKTCLSGTTSWIPQILSFHSYEGLNDVRNRPSAPANTVVLISASSSGNMASEIIRDWKIPAPNVITLLSYKKAPKDSLLMHKLDEPKTTKKQSDELIPVKIQGEFFIPVYNKPRIFLIKHIHSPKYLKDLMASLYDQDIFLAHKEGHPIWVEPEALLKNTDFLGWFDHLLSRRAPLRVSHVIFDEESSESLADKVVEFYNDKSVSVVKVAASKILKETSAFQSVIVVASIVKSGSSLLNISRDLRNKVKGNDKSISYFVGLHLPASEEKGDIFQSSLVYSSARNFKHNFDAWFRMPVSEDKLNPWQTELDFLQRNEFEGIVEVQSRIETLRSSEGLTEQCFWNTLVNNKLCIQKDFVFWDKSFASERATNNVNVFFTISCILQNARNLSDGEALRASEYESVCLDPECFFRFNDGVIQASLLRAAKKSELNYSLDNESSDLMTDMIVKMINNQSSTVAEALPEFILALATRKLLLNEEGREKVKMESEVLPVYLKKMLIVGLDD